MLFNNDFVQQINSSEIITTSDECNDACFHKFEEKQKKKFNLIEINGTYQFFQC